MSVTVIQSIWEVIGDTDNQATNANTYDTAYPAAASADRSDNAVAIPCGAMKMRLRVAGFKNAAAVDGYTGRMKTWLWDANGAPLDLFEFDFTTGTAVITANPVSGAAFSDTTTWAYADVFTEVAANISYAKCGTADGVGEILFDLLEGSYILTEFDLDVPDGTNLTAALAVGKFMYNV